MRRYIATRRLTGVELLGRVSEADKNRSFVTADIYLSPATGQESFGVVLLEAHGRRARRSCAATSTATRASSAAASRRLLVPPTDVDALADALATLLRDPQMRQRMGESARQRARQFSWDNITAKVEDYYLFVIRRAGGAGRTCRRIPTRRSSRLPARATADRARSRRDARPGTRSDAGVADQTPARDPLSQAAVPLRRSRLAQPVRAA